MYQGNRGRFLALTALLVASCSPIRGCVESQFELAPESRLPRWVPVPAGYSRSDLVLEAYYYVPPFPVDDTVFVLRSHDGRKLRDLSGKQWSHPRTQKQL